MELSVHDMMNLEQQIAPIELVFDTKDEWSLLPHTILAMWACVLHALLRTDKWPVSCVVDFLSQYLITMCGSTFLCLEHPYPFPSPNATPKYPVSSN